MTHTARHVNWFEFGDLWIAVNVSFEQGEDGGDGDGSTDGDGDNGSED